MLNWAAMQLVRGATLAGFKSFTVDDKQARVLVCRRDQYFQLRNEYLALACSAILQLSHSASRFGDAFAFYRVASEKRKASQEGTLCVISTLLLLQKGAAVHAHCREPLQLACLGGF
jgi:hypothetical protein